MKRTPLSSLCLIAGLCLAAPGLAAPPVTVTVEQGMLGGMMGGLMGNMNSYAMRMFDADKDGTLTPEEMAAGMQAEIKTYDTDTSGTLSLAEFEAMHAAHTRTMLVRAFQMHDEDGDGQVTEAEIATMARMMQMMARSKGGPGMQGDNGGMMDDN